MVQESRFDQILPMQIDTDGEDEEQDAGAAEYLYEPDGQEIVERQPRERAALSALSSAAKDNAKARRLT